MIGHGRDSRRKKRSVGGCAPLLRVIIERLGQRHDSLGVDCAMKANINIMDVKTNDQTSWKD
jgi:hypothetical protein